MDTELYIYIYITVIYVYKRKHMIEYTWMYLKGFGYGIYLDIGVDNVAAGFETTSFSFEHYVILLGRFHRKR